MFKETLYGLPWGPKWGPRTSQEHRASVPWHSWGPKPTLRKPMCGSCGVRFGSAWVCFWVLLRLVWVGFGFGLGRLSSAWSLHGLEASRPQTSEVLKLSRLRAFRVSRLQGFKISGFQGFDASRLQAARLQRFALGFGLNWFWTWFGLDSVLAELEMAPKWRPNVAQMAPK